MAKGHKPKAGSRAYWPRKRAKRIYPRFKNSEEIEKVKLRIKEVKPLGFAGYKAGMTHVIFRDERKESVTQGQDLGKAVTVLDCPPLFVFGIKLYKKELTKLRDMGTIFAENLKKDLERKIFITKKKNKIKDFEKRLNEISDIRLLVHTQPRDSGIKKKTPEIFEIDLSGANAVEKWKYALSKLGKGIEVSEIFSEGEYVDTKTVSKGKGYQGVVKRFGVIVRGRKNKGKRRHIGTMGPVTPGRVLPSVIPQAGQLGFQTRTEYNKRILKLGNDGFKPKGGFVRYGLVPKTYVLIEGSVPGPKKRVVMFRKSFRKFELKEPVEISYISLESQQK